MAFETIARAKRYQALGMACMKNQLSTLLIGHHLDDNVETGLLRMTPTAKIEGLAGIAPVAKIPECHGLWAVSESGSIETIRGRQRILRPNPPTIASKRTTRPSTIELSFPMATGGILLCRPLLPFYKASIVETCREANVPFVTDSTNFDPTLTTRNTIRSLIASEKLPQALRPASISSFLAKNRVSLLDTMAETDRLLQQCQLLTFYPQASTMEIKFPELDLNSSDAPNIRILAATLRRITNLITPRPEVKNQALRLYERFAQEIFTGQQKTDFTVAGVHFKVQDSINEKGEDPLSGNAWHISRAPFMANAAPILEVDNLTDDWSHPVLWDNRFWLQFRLKNHHHHPSSADPANPPTAEELAAVDSQLSSNLRITIRPLGKEDMSYVTEYLAKTRKGHQFAKWAPRNSRFTLPIITTTTVISSRSSSSTAAAIRKQRLRRIGVLMISGNAPKELYIGLPTLGFMDMQKDHEEDIGARIECRWIYKNIDAEALKLMGWLAEDHQEVAGYYGHY